MDDVPIGTIELLKDTIWLHNLALMDPVEIDIVTELIDELLKLVDCDPAANLRHIILVPDIDATCYLDRAIVRLMNDAPIEHGPLLPVARFASFPIVSEGIVTTFLIVNETMVHGLTPDNAHRLDVISAILEGLLHAHFHVRTRMVGANMSGRPEGCMERGSVHELAARTLEAYLVYRTKLAIMCNNALIEREADPQPKALFPRAPVDTAARLDHASEEIRAVVCCATSGKIAADEAWTKIRRILFRGMLDPLARHTAYRDHPADSAGLTAALQRSSFYVSDVAPFWERAGDELRLAYGKQCETAACIDTLETLLDRFLTHLGICAALDAVALHFDLRWAGNYVHQ